MIKWIDIKGRQKRAPVERKRWRLAHAFCKSKPFTTMLNSLPYIFLNFHSLGNRCLNYDLEGIGSANLYFSLWISTVLIRIQELLYETSVGIPCTRTSSNVLQKRFVWFRVNLYTQLDSLQGQTGVHAAHCLIMTLDYHCSTCDPFCTLNLIINGYIS